MFQDPFNDTSVQAKKATEDTVHIRVQQRNGRKNITTVQGLATDLDLKKILRYWRKEFNCNGTIVKDEELGKVIQMSGDQRKNVNQFLVDEKICTKEQIKTHGF